jgi:hypothetical protein
MQEELDSEFLGRPVHFIQEDSLRPEHLRKELLRVYPKEREQKPLRLFRAICIRRLCHVGDFARFAGHEFIALRDR